MPKRRRETIKDFESKTTNKRRKLETDFKKQIQTDQHKMPVVEKVEQEKKLLVRVGVSCFMIIFFIIWIFSLKYEFKASLNKKSDSKINWGQAKIELTKTMAQLKQSLAEIKKIQADSSQNAWSSQRSGEASEPKLTAEQLDLLKDKLLDGVASTTTASSTKTIKNYELIIN